MLTRPPRYERYHYIYFFNYYSAYGCIFIGSADINRVLIFIFANTNAILCQYIQTAGVTRTLIRFFVYTNHHKLHNENTKLFT